MSDNTPNQSFPILDFHSLSKWKSFLEMEEKLSLAYYETIDHYRNTVWEELLRIGAVKLVDISNFLHLKQKEQLLEGVSIDPEYQGLVNLDFKEQVRYDSRMFRSAFKFRVFWLKGILDHNLKRLSKLPKRKVYYNQYSVCHSTLEHMKTQSDIGLILPFFISVKGAANERPEPNVQIELKKVLDQLLKAISKHLEGSPFQPTTDQVSFLKDMLLRYHASFYTDYLRIKSMKRLPGEIYHCSNNKTHVRMLSQAVRMNGGTCTGSSHGEPLIYEWEKTTWMELLAATDFLEYNSSLAAELTHSINSGTTCWGPVPKIKHFENAYHFNTAYVKPDALKHVKKALLIGNFFLDIGFSSVSSFEPLLQLHIESTVLRAMNNFGIQTDYKKHPGGLLVHSIDTHYKDLCATISEPFEEVLDNYDLIVFYYTRTSTMLGALESNKDILIIDTGIETLAPESTGLLRERCFYTPFEDLPQGLSQYFGTHSDQTTKA